MKLKIFSIGLLALLVASCGGRKSTEPADITVKAEETTVGGTLGQYVTLNAGDYTVQIDESGATSLTVNLSVEAIPELSESKSLSGVKATVNFLDANKTPISVDITENYNSELSDALKSGASKLSFNFRDGYLSDDKIKLIKEKAKYIEVDVSGSLYEKSSSSSSTSSESSSSDESDADESVESSSSTSSSDINAWLDKYEKAMDTYVKLAKKASSGDITAMTEMASYLDQVNDLYSDLEKVESDMTPAQAARLSKIYAKMASAMM